MVILAKAFGFLLFMLLDYAFADELLSKFHQNTYKIKDFHGELDYYDKKVINHVHMVTFKYNRTTAALNFTFNSKRNVTAKQLDVLVQVYKLLSNQYREFPIRFRVNLQKAVHMNMCGLLNYSECGNIDIGFIQKDVTYYICNFVPDATKAPPLIPTGRFKIQMELIYLENIIMTTSNYVEIYIPFKYPAK